MFSAFNHPQIVLFCGFCFQSITILWILHLSDSSPTEKNFSIGFFFKVGTKGTSQLDPKSFPSALLFVQPLWVWVESGDKLAWWKISLCQQKFNRLKFCVGIYFFVDSTFNRTVVVCLQITSIHLSVKREDWSKSFGSNVLTAMTRRGIKPFRDWRGVW